MTEDEYSTMLIQNLAQRMREEDELNQNRSILPYNNKKMTATQILEQDYRLHMNLIEAYRKDGDTDEEILEFMRAS